MYPGVIAACNAFRGKWHLWFGARNKVELELMGILPTDVNECEKCNGGCAEVCVWSPRDPGAASVVRHSCRGIRWHVSEELHSHAASKPNLLCFSLSRDPRLSCQQWRLPPWLLPPTGLLLVQLSQRAGAGSWEKINTHVRVCCSVCVREREMVPEREKKDLDSNQLTCRVKLTQCNINLTKRHSITCNLVAQENS